MKFGVREICDVVFKALDSGRMGSYSYVKGQPVLYIDSAKTSAMEGAATTVYAQGGRGNTRLLAWEGEKTLTFTVEDALLSPIGFAILSGAGLFAPSEGKVAIVHYTEKITPNTNKELVLTKKASKQAPIFVLEEYDGSYTRRIEGITLDTTQTKLTGSTAELDTTKSYFVDYYVEKTATTAITELQIDAAHFGGYFYVEASTLFRRESDGKDLPAEIVLPKVKIQSNFSFNMSSTGDPSTVTFTMDAMPGYTYFDKTKKVLCVIQIVEDTEGSIYEWDTVMPHVAEESGKEFMDINNNATSDEEDELTKDSTWPVDQTDN